MQALHVLTFGRFRLQYLHVGASDTQVSAQQRRTAAHPQNFQRVRRFAAHRNRALTVAITSSDGLSPPLDDLVSATPLQLRGHEWSDDCGVLS